MTFIATLLLKIKFLDSYTFPKVPFPISFPRIYFSLGFPFFCGTSISWEIGTFISAKKNCCSIFEFSIKVVLFFFLLNHISSLKCELRLESFPLFSFVLFLG